MQYISTDDKHIAEAYQAAGLLPENYVHCREDDADRPLLKVLVNAFAGQWKRKKG